MARRLVNWTIGDDGASLGRLDLKPGQEIWDQQAVRKGDEFAVVAIVEDAGQPLRFDYWVDIRRTADDFIGRKVISKDLDMDEAPVVKDFFLLPQGHPDVRRWAELAYRD